MLFRSEAEVILRRRLDSSAQIKKALRHFHACGIHVVLLSLGARGAVASDGKNIWYARAPRVRAVNDVGCGDALLAGFCSTFDKKSLAEALRRGVACGTANALNPVPGSIDPEQVRQLERKVALKSWALRKMPR